VIEANSRISWWQIRKLKSRIADPALWRIRRHFEAATFMFYTDQQRDERKLDGRQRQYSRAYYDLLKPNDEFGYLNAETFTASFDSKETLDRDYGGSWFNYDR
jgi:hypothetical protein